MPNVPKTPSPLTPFLEELFDVGIKVGARAFKRGVAAVVGSALEDVGKANTEIGRRVARAHAKAVEMMRDAGAVDTQPAPPPDDEGEDDADRQP